jgi:hypothetical protein
MENVQNNGSKRVYIVVRAQRGEGVHFFGFYQSYRLLSDMIREVFGEVHLRSVERQDLRHTLRKGVAKVFKIEHNDPVRQERMDGYYVLEVVPH